MDPLKWILWTLVVVTAETPPCHKKTSTLGGEELVCHNVTGTFFRTFDLILDKTHWLTCDDCRLDVLDDETLNVPKNSLAFLYLTSSGVTTIGDLAFRKFPTLRTLALFNNSIADLAPKAFSGLAKLINLNLSHNHIRVITNDLFGDLKNLDMITLTHNEIVGIEPDGFRGLKNLKYLYLSHNHLQKIEGYTFKHLPNLVLLYLENNRIREIDNFAFVNLTRLHSLYLNNNSITFLVPYNFKPLAELVDLQLRFNNLTQIQTSSFNGLSNLRNLYLGENHLELIKPYGLIGLDKLLNLELIGNHFRTFELMHLKDLTSLNTLWLERNLIDNFSIDHSAEELDMLHTIGLEDNDNLTSLNYMALYNKVPNLRDVYITRQRWKCEFLVNWFNFAREKSFNVCASPKCSANETMEFIDKVCASKTVKSGGDFEESDSDFTTESAATLGSGSVTFLCIFLVIRLV